MNYWDYVDEDDIDGEYGVILGGGWLRIEDGPKGDAWIESDSPVRIEQ